MGLLIKAGRYSEITEEEGERIMLCTEAHGGWSSGWCAKLALPTTGADRRYGVAREFLRADSMRLSRAGNGEKYYRLPGPGVYECDSVYRSCRSHRVYVRVCADGVAKILADSAYTDRGLDVALDALREEVSHATA